jgi:hypothetical protein
MPVQVSYPGVYIEEVASGARTITGVATSITAFMGRARRGPTNEPTVITSFGDFDRQFGGLRVEFPMSYAVRDFYLNGGSQAIIVRLYLTPGADADGKPRRDGLYAGALYRPGRTCGLGPGHTFPVARGVPGVPHAHLADRQYPAAPCSLALAL